MNIIGSIVVAGNVRRSAQIALGDVDDKQYLDAKNWSKGNIPNWRAMSNNSVICNDINHLPAKFWNGYNGDGEAYGLVNLQNCQLYGRLADGKEYRPDKDVIGTNPCGEVPLGSQESCNLAEIFLPNIRDGEEFKEVAKLLYMATKTISCLNFIHKGTQDIVSKNHRLGIGVTGFLQAGHLRKEEIFNDVYHSIEQLDKEYSKNLKTKTSIKLTTTKPSGTLSLLPGVTPGVHPAYAPYYIRRIRMSSEDPLVEICRKNWYHVEPARNFDGSFDRNTAVVSFPVKTPEGTICAKDMTAIQQIEWHKWLQTYWADNSVSVTVYYRKEELPEIQNWLKDNYNDNVKTISFLLHKDHGFHQAPYEEITKEQFDEITSKVKPIVRIEDSAEYHELVENLECTKGCCPVR
jgi:adenosylcobalamin-dependent ribonucleoside-triphosphate reductase